jgi:hypothetical protein
MKKFLNKLKKKEISHFSSLEVIRMNLRNSKKILRIIDEFVERYEDFIGETGELRKDVDFEMDCIETMKEILEAEAED